MPQAEKRINSEDNLNRRGAEYAEKGIVQNFDLCELCVSAVK
jgi:hypothetical protein